MRLLAGEPELAEAALRGGLEQARARSARADMLATTAAMLAQAVYAQGRFEEAGELCRLARMRRRPTTS